MLRDRPNRSWITNREIADRRLAVPLMPESGRAEGFVMKRLSVFILIVMPLLLAGCNSHSPQVRALLRENRILENEMFRLRAQLQNCDNCPNGATVQRAQPTYIYTEGSGPSIAGPAMTYDHDPVITSDTPRRLDEPTRLPADDSPRTDRPNETPIDAAQYPTIEARDDNTLVNYLTLDEKLTRPIHLDNRHGHDGLVVFVEPRDRQAQVLKAPAEINVVLVDTEQPEDFASVARWNFTKEETARLFYDIGSGSAIVLKLPWPGAPPTNTKMLLLVRYITDNGRRLQVEREMKFVLPDRSAAPPARREACPVPEPIDDPPAPSRSVEEPVAAPPEPSRLEMGLPDGPPSRYDGVAPKSDFSSPYGPGDIGRPPNGLAPSGTSNVEPIIPNVGPATDPDYYRSPIRPDSDPGYGPAAPGPAIDPMRPGVVPEAIPPGSPMEPTVEPAPRDPPGVSRWHRPPTRTTSRQAPVWGPSRPLR